jgi:uncharacterized protein DUF1579
MRKSGFRTNVVLLVIVALFAIVSARIASHVVSAEAAVPSHANPLNMSPMLAQDKTQEAAPAPASKAAPSPAEIVKAMDNAMDPGEGQKKLQPLVGTFDVRIFTWVDPSKPPIESRAVAIHTWVLGHRYVQTMLSGFVMGEPFNAIGYAGYDNLQKKYVACYMDSGSTGMEWYTGGMDPDGKSAKLTGSIYDAITLKPTKIEMRVYFTPGGDHHTEFWQADSGGKMFKAIEVQYRRQIS